MNNFGLHPAKKIFPLDARGSENSTNSSSALQFTEIIIEEFFWASTEFRRMRKSSNAMLEEIKIKFDELCKYLNEY